MRRDPQVKTICTLGVENEWTDAERDGRACFASPFFQAGAGTCYDD